MVSVLCISLDLEAEEEKLVSPLGECNRFCALLRWEGKRALLYLPVQSAAVPSHGWADSLTETPSSAVAFLAEI